MRHWQFASGLPPELLEHRPDGRQADQNRVDLASIMAGVLRALFGAFPARSSCRIKSTGFVKPGCVCVTLISREPSWRLHMTSNSSTARITGGTSGIGRATAQKPAQIRIHVLVV